MTDTLNIILDGKIVKGNKDEKIKIIDMHKRRVE
jgi:hypothetical protein